MSVFAQTRKYFRAGMACKRLCDTRIVDTADRIVSLAAVEAAREQIRDTIHRTPMLSSATAARLIEEAGGPRLAGGRLQVKAEHLQKTGSFKTRGMVNRILTLTDAERARGVITVSAGNAARRARGRPGGRRAGDGDHAEGAVRSKLDACRDYGAEVVVHGSHVGEMFAEQERLSAERGLTFMHPFDDPELIAGHGSAGLEILEDLPDVDVVVVVPVGGGGLISGDRDRGPRRSGRRRGSTAIEPERRERDASRARLRRAASGSSRSRRRRPDGRRSPAPGRSPLCQRYLDDVIVLIDDATILARAALRDRADEAGPRAGRCAPRSPRSSSAGSRSATARRSACVASGGNVEVSRIGRAALEAASATPRLPRRRRLDGDGAEPTMDQRPRPDTPPVTAPRPIADAGDRTRHLSPRRLELQAICRPPASSHRRPQRCSRPRRHRLRRPSRPAGCRAPGRRPCAPASPRRRHRPRASAETVSSGALDLALRRRRSRVRCVSIPRIGIDALPLAGSRAVIISWHLLALKSREPRRYLKQRRSKLSLPGGAVSRAVGAAAAALFGLATFLAVHRADRRSRVEAQIIGEPPSLGGAASGRTTGLRRRPPPVARAVFWKRRRGRVPRVGDHQSAAVTYATARGRRPARPGRDGGWPRVVEIAASEASRRCRSGSYQAGIISAAASGHRVEAIRQALRRQDPPAPAGASRYVVAAGRDRPRAYIEVFALGAGLDLVLRFADAAGLGVDGTVPARHTARVSMLWSILACVVAVELARS